MSSVSSTSTASYVDGDLTDADFDPLLELYLVVGDVTEEMYDWYDEVTDLLDTGTDYLTWFAETCSGGGSAKNNYKDAPYAEREEFIEWLDSLSFDSKYITVSGFGNADKWDFDSVYELISLEVESLSTNCSQSLTFLETLIGKYEDNASEIKSCISSLRSAARGHIRQ